MFSRILVPVDFSRNSAVSLRYALDLAGFVGASSVKVIHVFTPSVATGDAITMSPVGELMAQREEDLKNFVVDMPTPAGVSRSEELLIGFAADKIVEVAGKADLIVMGSTGEADLLEQVFGSVSSSVAQRSPCPVLLVPKRGDFHDYENVLYASNNLSLSRRAVLRLMDFNELFRARIHFVHVNDEEGSHEGQREKLFAPLFANPDPEFSFEIKEVSAESVQEGLVEYLEDHPIDLAIMVTKHRGFWERLFHRSETRQMVLHPQTPLLIMHVNE